MVEVLLDGGGVSRNGGVEHRELVEAELMKSSSSASALSIMRAMVMRSRARRTHSLFSARALLSSHRPRRTLPPPPLLSSCSNVLLSLHAPTSSFSLLWSGAHMTSGDVCHEGSGEDRGYGGKDAPAPSSHFSCSKMLPAGDVHLAGWDLEAARDNLSVLLGPVFYNFAQHTTPHLPYIDKRTIRECKDACRELHIGMCATRSMTAGLRHMDSRDW
jgi:hypothetical protein